MREMLGNRLAKWLVGWQELDTVLWDDGRIYYAALSDKWFTSVVARKSKTAVAWLAKSRMEQHTLGGRINTDLWRDLSRVRIKALACLLLVHAGLLGHAALNRYPRQEAEVDDGRGAAIPRSPEPSAVLRILQRGRGRPFYFL
jgi:hypothetical protein